MSRRDRLDSSEDLPRVTRRDDAGADRIPDVQLPARGSFPDRVQVTGAQVPQCQTLTRPDLLHLVHRRLSGATAHNCMRHAGSALHSCALGEDRQILPRLF